MLEHLQRAEHDLRTMPPEVSDGVPILLNVVGAIARALEQAFATDAAFIGRLMGVRDGLLRQLTDTVPVFAVRGEKVNSARARLTALAVDEALRK